MSDPRIEVMKDALNEIATSKFCAYENTESGSCGIGVTDGHRYCSKIANNALATVTQLTTKDMDLADQSQ